MDPRTKVPSLWIKILPCLSCFNDCVGIEFAIPKLMAEFLAERCFLPVVRGSSIKRDRGHDGQPLQVMPT